MRIKEKCLLFYAHKIFPRDCLDATWSRPSVSPGHAKPNACQPKTAEAGLAGPKGACEGETP